MAHMRPGGMSAFCPLSREKRTHFLLETTFGATNLADDVTAFMSFAVTKHWLEIGE